MGAPATANHSAFACREQSLIRSFSAIHCAPVNSDVSPSSPVSKKSDDALKRDRRGEVIRSSLQEGRRPARNKTITSKVDNVIPALPFTASHGSSPRSPQQRESLRERSPAKKFQRRHSPITAHVAQEMVAELTMEMQYERRNNSLIRAASSDGVVKTNKQGVAANFKDQEAEKGPHLMGFRGDYSIGEILRCPSHMIVPHIVSEQQAISTVGLLSTHDFAFVKRSNGFYSYAILAYRSWELVKGTDNTKEECMVFVVSDGGSTKAVRQRHWGECVRHVSMEGLYLRRVTSSGSKTCAAPRVWPLAHHFKMSSGQLRQEIQSPEMYRELSPPGLCQQIKREGDAAAHDDDVPPCMISFVPQIDDECSLISSVSDRAS